MGSPTDIGSPFKQDQCYSFNAGIQGWCLVHTVKWGCNQRGVGIQVVHSAILLHHHHGEQVTKLHEIIGFTQPNRPCACNLHCQRLDRCFNIRKECLGSASSTASLRAHVKLAHNKTHPFMGTFTQGNMSTTGNCSSCSASPAAEVWKITASRCIPFFGDGSALKTRRTPLLVILAAIAGPSQGLCLESSTLGQL